MYKRNARVILILQGADLRTVVCNIPVDLYQYYTTCTHNTVCAVPYMCACGKARYVQTCIRLCHCLRSWYACLQLVHNTKSVACGIV